ncbi:glycoside hydrolase [Yamadazyma tenuis ATCC 10573]|uniref:Glycoside hydrolase n=1 Tax=Candida tenuis (strain ATCC 10573 / BCRC 21748 / CBS 615 / JCM 9827 / NBRC 10315 / NRRL Y-1498 / VKM Y-70) TaxID=590646 RepID=G3BEU6_CANTC|nr:glycoside hydrolase [Yamadazyma tenuis ATCC 10573]EGV60595.1 glycoside hydrolase [Yamadazyma tenuis ATCC 10573]
MSSRDKSNLPVGQLLCGGFEGTGVTSQAYHLIVEHRVSTILMSKKNSVSVKQMTKLIRDLQYIAYTEANYKYPLLFAIDQEGGIINQLFDPEYLSQFPGAMALSAIGDTELVYQVSKALALELKQIGFSIMLGPVIDVVTKLSHQLLGVRSFGTTIEDVVKNGRACARGFRDGGLFTFAKHFPGIGNASVDSLLELPMLTDSLEQVKHFNAVPFRELIKEDMFDGVSAAGCGVPTISPDEIHACLSPVLVNQLLRQEIGFKGVVISECLEMDALHHSIGLGQGVILALYAGCDLIMVCHDVKLQDEAVGSMKNALQNGNLDEEIVLASLARIEKLQKKLSTWKQLFPNGEESAKSEDLNLFKDTHKDLWEAHQRLSETAYKGSITLVRDYTDALPITKFLNKTKGSASSQDNTNNILLLTPLLNPIPRSHSAPDPQLYNGEEVFKELGNMLAEHSFNKGFKNPYNVLHTTYTANGLTSLHESLIEHAKIVIVVTSEASRNMYQIGIVKYVSMLCGANPSSFNNGGQTYTQLAKPLILVATSSPYDFFYNKSIGSAYLCCYDYTSNALKQLVKVLMGDVTAEGCIPGEKKYIGRTKKRSYLEASKDLTPRPKKNNIPVRRWLVDEFVLDRDWDGLVTLMKNNFENSTSPLSDYSHSNSDNFTSINYQDDSFYKNFHKLLESTKTLQKHFVIRNSSLNILYGVVLTWVDHVAGSSKTGSIMYILVDRTKRVESIGKNLHNRAMRYLIREQKCATLTLGVSLPLVLFPNETNLLGSASNSRVISFMNSFGWNPSISRLNKRYIMMLDDLERWSVPKKIFRELMIVGVRFDICNDADKVMNFINKNNEAAINKQLRREALKDELEHTKSLYLKTIKYLKEDSGVKIIIALEPSHQTIIGSIILFSNKSQLAKYYPFIDEAGNDQRSSPVASPSSPIVGGLVAPVIDSSYSSLTEIFKYGLICSGITLLKSSFNEEPINRCLMMGINDNINGIKEIGFQEWKYYYENYDKRTDVGVFDQN